MKPFATKVNFKEYAEQFDSLQEALEMADADGYAINKYADAISEAAEGLTVEEAHEVAKEDINLIWLEGLDHDAENQAMHDDYMMSCGE